MSAEISKQEFLKRYLENDKDSDRKRKKRPKTKSNISRLKIVDQNIDLKSIKFGEEADDDEYDEAPVIAEVIDERPVEIKLKEIYESSRWKKIDNSDDSQAASSSVYKDGNIESDVQIQSSARNKLSPPVSLKRDGLGSTRRTRWDSDNDLSPPRSPKQDFNKKIHNSNSAISVPRNTKQDIGKKRHDSGSDISPPRSPKLDCNKKRHDSDSDGSLPRNTKQDFNKKRHDSDSDVSLPRNTKQDFNKKRHDSDSDISLPRNQKNANINIYDSDSDISPPRNQQKHARKKRFDSDSDISSSQNDSHYRNKKSKNDKSPVQQNLNKSDRHLKRIGSQHYSGSGQLSEAINNQDALREKHYKKYKTKLPCDKCSDSDLSPERSKQNKNSDGDMSPLRYQSSKKISFDKNGKPTKTLSGLKAGLQNSMTLKQETQEQRKREKKQINMLDDEVSGRNADTIVRDRRTGMKRDLEQEKKKKEEENKKIEEHQQKYVEWGKGIEQTQSKKDKFADDLYEMSKPLARYNDDKDLDERLKSIIHDDDPMAEFIKKKRKKDAPNVPVYNGPPAPPNRFGILPGFRWDGVDRSNGFEKKYFEKNNRTKATQEEAYLWSVQNM